MRTGLLGLLSLLALAVAAPAASASYTATFDGGTDTLTVNSNEAGDTIILTCPGSNLLVNNVNPSTGPLPCTGGPAAATISLLGNGGADTLDVSALTGLPVGSVNLDGGEGDDDLRGVALTSNGQVVSLLGGPGNDLLTPNSSDAARGGSGDDRITGFVQDGGILDGEQGNDTFAFTLPPTPVSFTFTVADGGLTISAPGTPNSQTVPWLSIEAVDLVLNDAPQTVDGRSFSGSLKVDMRDGADTIYGTAAADVLLAGAGNDFVDGGAGADVYQGGSGSDRLEARDGVADSGDCGPDGDTLIADRIDAIAGCETVELPARRDKKKPRLKLKAATLGPQKLRLPIACPKNEIRCGGQLTLAAVGEHEGRAARVKLGTIVFKLRGGKAQTLLRTVSVPKRRLLRDLDKAKLTVRLDVVDAAGNRTRGVKRVGLKL